MKTVKLKNVTVIVDDDDYLRYGKYVWCEQRRNSGTYITVYMNKRDNPSRKTLFLHRLIAGTPDGMETDHVNGDTLDNRKCNLRICTRAETVTALNICLEDTARRRRPRGLTTPLQKRRMENLRG